MARFLSLFPCQRLFSPNPSQQLNHTRFIYPCPSYARTFIDPFSVHLYVYLLLCIQPSTPFYCEILLAFLSHKMVEVSQNLSGILLNEDKSSQPTAAVKHHLNAGRKNFPTDDQLAALRRSAVAASKRSLMKMRNPRGGRTASQSTNNASAGAQKSPNSPSPSAGEEDPKRSRAEASPSSLGEPGLTNTPPKQRKAMVPTGPSSEVRQKPLFQRRARNHSAPLFLESIDQGAANKAPAHPEIVCQVSHTAFISMMHTFEYETYMRFSLSSFQT